MKLYEISTDTVLAWDVLAYSHAPCEQATLDAVNLGPFVGVDLNLWPIAYNYNRCHADTDIK